MSSEMIAWFFVAALALVSWHNYQRWQFWADEWLKDSAAARSEKKQT